MSLETALAENTAAVKALTVALGTGQPVNTQRANDTQPVTVDSKSTKAAKAEAKKQADTSVVTMKQTADAIVDLANNYSRDAAVDILKAAGVQRASELKPDAIPGVFNAVNVKIKEFKAAAAALAKTPAADSLV